jgi:hypothetical protein
MLTSWQDEPGLTELRERGGSETLAADEWKGHRVELMSYFARRLTA